MSIKIIAYIIFLNDLDTYITKLLNYIIELLCNSSGIYILRDEYIKVKVERVLIKNLV